MIKVFPDFFTDNDLFGVSEANISRAIESLPGIAATINYTMKYKKSWPVESTVISNSISDSVCTDPSDKSIQQTGERYAVIYSIETPLADRHRHYITGITAAI